MKYSGQTTEELLKLANAHPAEEIASAFAGALQLPRPHRGTHEWYVVQLMIFHQVMRSGGFRKLYQDHRDLARSIDGTLLYLGLQRSGELAREARSVLLHWKYWPGSAEIVARCDREYAEAGESIPDAVLALIRRSPGDIRIGPDTPKDIHAEADRKFRGTQRIKRAMYLGQMAVAVGLAAADVCAAAPARGQ